MILKAKEKHLNDLTSLHRLVLGDTSSSKFGHEFVKNLYKTLIRYDGARVWIICNNREVFGFISVCNEIRTTTKWIKTNLKTKHYLSLIKIFIFHPKEIFNLLERIIFEIKYFSETGKHLDIKGLTFCSGSRYSDGDVPSAGWALDEFWVDWCGLDYSRSDFGIRSAVRL